MSVSTAFFVALVGLAHAGTPPGAPMFRFEASSQITQLVLSPDGRRVAYAFYEASDEGTYALEVRRVAGGRPVRLVPNRRYAPCVCDGGIGAVTWLDNRRLRVVAGFETDGGGAGETLITFDGWTGRLLSIRDVRLTEHGVRSVRPERQAAQRALLRAFSKLPPGFDLQTSLDLGVDVDARTHLTSIDAGDAYEHGLYAVDLVTAKARYLAPLDDRFLLGGARVGNAFVVLLEHDGAFEFARVAGGRATTIAAVDLEDTQVELETLQLAGRTWLFVANTGGAAGEVRAGRLYETDGHSVRPAPGYDGDVYAASSDASGRVVAISRGSTAEIVRP